MNITRKEYGYQIDVPDNIKSYITGRKAAFFDIETTGLSSTYNSIILIGLSYIEDDEIVVEQYFAENLEEERDILKQFRDRIDSFNMVVTYNGKNFDVPFVNRRMEKHNIDYSINHEHFDLINHVRPNKQILGLESCSLKSVERRLNINRNDTIDGEESIRLYYEYLKSRDKGIKERILLHNYEDVYNLPKILNIFRYIEYRQNPEGITEKQKSFLKNLLKRQNIELIRDIDCISKHEASELIDYLLNGGKCSCLHYIEIK